MSAFFLRLVALTIFCAALSAQPLASGVSVPRLVRFSGSFRPANGSQSTPVNGSPSAMEGVTLAIYRDQTGGSPLWQEVQNVAIDSEGRYSLLLGATLTDGIPMDLFASNEPRWLGVQFNRPGEAEQPRVLLASVPYALNAETLGGKPASAYVLAESSAPSTPSTPGSAGVIGAASSTGGSTSPAANALKPRVTGGTPGFLGVFVNSTDLGNSVMQQANGAVGVGTVPGAGAPTTPSLDLRTAPFSQIGMAQSTDYLTFFSSDTFGPAIYWNPAKDMRLGKGGTGLYNAFGFIEQMRIQSSTGNVGIGTQAPASRLDVAGDINFTGNILHNGALVVHDIPALLSVGVGKNTLLNTTGGSNTAVGTFALVSNTTGNFNVAVGDLALRANTGGTFNIAIGSSSLLANTIGSNNVAAGVDVLQNNTSGSGNVGVGTLALAANVSGSSNTALGLNALGANTADFNTAAGADSLAANTTGSTNSAFGYKSLMNNGTGGDNTAVGAFALEDNASGNFNVAVGNQALQNSTASQSNTALGAFTLTLNTTGMNNTASGYNALSGNQAGSFNVADGAGALLNNNGDSNTAVGADALFNNGSGTNNIAIGQNAAINVTGTNSNIHIGNVGSSADNATIKIGTPGTQTSFFAAGIRGVMTGANNGVPVIIDGNGQLGTVNSSRRFKEDIQDMGDSSRALMQLRPVTFRYKQPYADGSKPIQYGLIAEEVAEVYPGLVAHSADGQIESVKYQVLDSMLLNELQRQQAKIAAQEELIQKLLDRVSKLESARSESQDR